jgi:glycogen synthase
MKGYPKHLNTKQDYEYVRNHFPKRKWRKDFEALLEGEKAFQVTKTLADGEKGVEDETHKVIESDDEIVQMELKTDENSKMKRIGFSHGEIEKILRKHDKNN